MKSKKYSDYLMIMIGTTIIAFGVNQFLVPCDLVIGGLAGLAIIIQHITQIIFGTPIPIWLTNILVNVPLFAMSIKQRGFKFGAKSMFATFFLSFSLWFTQYCSPILSHNNLFLSCIYGAVTLGGGIGLVLRASASTGGTDMAANIISYKFKFLPISKVIMMLDSTIILGGAVAFGVEKAMYALVSAFVVSKVISAILEGLNFAKATLIISDKSEEISRELIKNIKRGVTSIKGTGMYTNNERNMLYVVVSQKQIFALQEIVKGIDPKAFITINDVREVYGQGFIELQK